MTASDHTGQHDQRPRPAASPRRVLLVEDEMMIRLLLEDMLEDLGYSIAATAGHVEEGTKLAREAEFDFAILDMNLNGRSVLPVADALAERGLPFLFASGYGEESIPDGHRGRPTLQKPFKQESLEQALEKLLGH
ncbi:MAG TPA: response regulator [Xanthobacteraceae bacterium]|nr:response regulator [Xanthobacteraceae bacterium]